MKSDYTTNSPNLIYTFLFKRSRRRYFLTLGVEGLNWQNGLVPKRVLTKCSTTSQSNFTIDHGNFGISNWVAKPFDNKLFFGYISLQGVVLHKPKSFISLLYTVVLPAFKVNSTFYRLILWQWTINLQQSTQPRHLPKTNFHHGLVSLGSNKTAALMLCSSMISSHNKATAANGSVHQSSNYCTSQSISQDSKFLKTLPNFFCRNQMIPEFEDVPFSMKTGHAHERWGTVLHLCISMSHVDKH